MPYFGAPFIIRGAYWVQAGLKDPVYVVTVPGGGRKSGVGRFLFRRSGGEMSQRGACGQGGDSYEGGGQWSDWRVLEGKAIVKKGQSH